MLAACEEFRAAVYVIIQSSGLYWSARTRATLVVRGDTSYIGGSWRSLFLFAVLHWAVLYLEMALVILTCRF